MKTKTASSSSHNVHFISWTRTVAERWRDWAASFPQANIFHTPEWIELLQKVYGYIPRLVEVQQDGEMTGGVPLMEVNSALTGRRIVSLPFSDHCEPLCKTDESRLALIGFLQEQSGLGNSQRYILKGDYPDIPGVQNQVVGTVHRTPLVSDPEELFKTFKKTRIQQPLRKAEQSGRLEIHRGIDIRTTMSYFKLQVQTRRRHGIPPQPWRHFKTLQKMLLEQDKGFILLAMANGEPVAGGVFLAGFNQLTYKYGASNPAAWDLYPNHLLLWNAISEACKSGCRIFDWGRTDSGHESLRDFKGGWGGEEKELVYCRIGKGRHTTFAKSRLQGILSSVLKTAPPFVARLSGEILYRHFA